MPTRLLTLLALWGLAQPAPTSASLEDPRFRAVGVAHSTHAISAMAVAPDGRLFAVINALATTTGNTPGQAQIRVYGTYSSNDAAANLDRGIVWATVDGVRATTANNTEEGVLGIAIAPDFPISKLVYVYLTTTDNQNDQEIRAYREQADGTGLLVGVVQGTLEPPTGSGTRNGGGLAFGADGCLYAGIGDNRNNNTDQWHAQLLLGTNLIQASENTGANGFCNRVCNGTTEYPNRTIAANDNLPNSAGKVLRMAVSQGGAAQPPPGNPLGAQPLAFATGLRNPTVLALHPLTGQLWATERSETQQAEVNVIDPGGNFGWPCLEGTVTSGLAGCTITNGVNGVYGNHPLWRRPLLGVTGSPVITGVAAYSGLAYPAEFFGDIFYLLRTGAPRIRRINLDPPCFLPNPNGVTDVSFHDTNQNGDFTVFFDFDNDGDFENVTFAQLTAIVQGPSPTGQQVLYVAGKQGTNSFTDDSVVFRLEYAAQLTDPYLGPTGRVADSCFANGTYSGGGPGGAPPYGYDNPFRRQQCPTSVGACTGPDGSPCGDTNPCNGTETCQGGQCQLGPPPADGTVACESGIPCLGQGVCQAGVCAGGPPVADGMPCTDGDPCNGQESCKTGTCQPVTVGPAAFDIAHLAIKRPTRGPASGSLLLAGSIQPTTPIDPGTTDSLAVELRDSADLVYSAGLEPGSPGWRKSRPPKVFVYQDGSGAAGGLTAIKLRQAKGRYLATIKGKRMSFTGLDEAALSARLVVGFQCFESQPECSLSDKKVRCR
jgi:glucose/arabinose dehydrogenase